MNDCRKQLVKALVSAIEGKLTTMDVYTRIPRGTDVTFPYVHISDIYQREDGTKGGFRYSYDVLIKIVYKDIASISTLYDSMNSVMTIFPNGGAPFTLEGGYKILEATLISATEEQILEDYGFTDVGLIRINFEIV